MSEYYRTWTSNNTSDPPPKDAPIMKADERSFWEELREQFRELQRRGW